jgi:hypothetical protein
MKTLEIGSDHDTQVYVIDEPGSGGAHHEYLIGKSNMADADQPDDFGVIHFQNGPILESGVNGCQNEDLLAIIIHRLQCFQDGPFRCRENGLALKRLEEAMHWLDTRTQARRKRDVEGRNIA